MNEIMWDTYMYLLDDALDRLTKTVQTYKQVEKKEMPYTFAMAARRSLGIIGDELSRYSTLDILPPLEKE